MGHRAPMVGGGEYDALCRKAKRWHIWRAGDRRYLKNKFNRRQRRLARLEVRA